jgi:hypothetical protein
MKTAILLVALLFALPVKALDAGVVEVDAGVAAPVASFPLKLDATVVVPPVSAPSIPAGSVAADGGSVEAAPAVPGATVAAPATDEEALKLAIVAVDLAKKGSWSLFAGVLLMLAIYLAKRFKLLEKVPDAAIPWVTMGVALLGTVGVTLANGGSVLVAVIAGVSTGAFATFVWEAIGKNFLGKKAAAAPAAPPAAPPAS